MLIGGIGGKRETAGGGGSETFYPIHTNDDGGWYLPIASFDWTFDGEILGSYPTTQSRGVWTRFDSVTIPQGSTITSCFVRFTSFGNYSVDTVNLTMYFKDADDVATESFTNITTVTGIDLTTGTNWDSLPSWSDGVQYDSVDISSDLQEVIDREGWSSGNGLLLIIHDDTSDSGAFRGFSTFGYSSGTEKQELHVEWTT